MDASKNFCDGESNFLNKESSDGVLGKNIFLADLSGCQYLFEILQTSLSVKNSENVVKSGCFEKRLGRRVLTFFQNQEGV